MTRKTIKEEEKFFETLTNEQKKEFNRLCELKTLNGAETDKNPERGTEASAGHPADSVFCGDEAGTRGDLGIYR